jgi:SAM-dependent methyltransferase
MPPSSDAPLLLNRLTTLSDMARLRMLRLLECEELSVGELASALQLPQSTVSRHLKVLHESGWLAKRTVGTASFYQLDGTRLDPPASALWQVASTQLGRSPTLDEDDLRLREVLAARRIDSRAFFGRIGGEWDELRQTLYGQDFTAFALLGLLDERWVVADIGCGTGNATDLLAPLVKSVIAIDREPAMLDAARKRLAGRRNVEFRQGDLSDLPVRSGEIDTAVAMLVMHHVPDPQDAVKEIARATKRGGVLLVVDMIAHDREEYRHTMGHVHLGFSERQVQRWARVAGLAAPRYLRLPPDPAGKGPMLFAAAMRKPTG